MEDIVNDQINLSVKMIVKNLNAERLANKDKWVSGSYTLVDIPKCTATVYYKMYNTWVQVLELVSVNDGKARVINDGSPMGMKPTAFKVWLEHSLKVMLKDIFQV